MGPVVRRCGLGEHADDDSEEPGDLWHSGMTLVVPKFLAVNVQRRIRHPVNRSGRIPADWSLNRAPASLEAFVCDIFPCVSAFSSSS